MKFGEGLKFYRELANLSQKDLAEKLCVPASMIGRYETTNTEPRIGFVIDVCRVLNVSIDDLMGFKVDAQKQIIDLLPCKIVDKTNEDIKIEWTLEANDENYNFYTTIKEGDFYSVIENIDVECTDYTRKTYENLLGYFLGSNMLGLFGKLTFEKDSDKDNFLLLIKSLLNGQH